MSTGDRGFGQPRWDDFTHDFNTDRSRALLDLGESLAESGDAREGLQAAMAAVDTARELEDADSEARAWGQAAQRHIELGQQIQARDCFAKAGRIHEELLQWRMQGRAQLAAFDAARMAGVPEENEDMLHEAYTLLLGSEDNQAASYAAARLAQREHAHGNEQPALDLLDQARTLAEDDIETVIMINDIQADVLIDLGRYCCALPLLWQAYDLSESLRQGTHPTYEAWRIVKTLRLNGEIRRSLELAESSVRILHHTKNTDADTYGSFHLEIARCLVALGETKPARTHLRKAHNHQLIAKNPAVLAECEQLMREMGVWEGGCEIGHGSGPHANGARETASIRG